MAMIKQQLVDSQYIKLKTTIEYNVDDAKLNPNIFLAQDMYLSDLIGDDFMEHLMEVVYNETENQKEKDLIEDYIKPMLCYWAIYISIEFLRNKITNKSISNENSQYSSSADYKSTLDLINTTRNYAEKYSNRLLKYLDKNYKDFPEYTSMSNCTNNNRTTYFSGLYIPKRKHIKIKTKN